MAATPRQPKSVISVAAVSDARNVPTVVKTMVRRCDRTASQVAAGPADRHSTWRCAPDEKTVIADLVDADVAAVEEKLAGKRSAIEPRQVR